MVATLFAITSFFLLFFGVLTLARRRNQYSHIRDTISELGEVGSDDSSLTSYGLFLPVAIILFATASMVWVSNHLVALLAICIGIGYFVSVIAPCDQGSPIAGSTRQSLHNIGGTIEYLGSTLSLWALSEKYGSVFFVSGWTIAFGTIIVSIPVLPWRGLVQRAMEITLFSCLIYGCWLTAS